MLEMEGRVEILQRIIGESLMKWHFSSNWKEMGMQAQGYQ